MPPGVFPTLIKSCLCFSLYFTFPIMMFPVSTLLEKQLSKTRTITYFKGVSTCPSFGHCIMLCVNPFLVHKRARALV